MSTTNSSSTSVSPLASNQDYKSGEKRWWNQLLGASKTLAIANTAAQYKGLTLIVTADTQHAHQIEQELSYYQPDLEVMNFPDWETLPYDVFSPHEDIISQRLETLSRLSTVKQGVLVVPISTLLHRLPPKSFVRGHSLQIKTGQDINVDEFRVTLEQAGYRRVDTVYEHGEFSVRGSIIDLFPMGNDLPFRIELFDDEVETLRTFDPENQRSLESVDEIRMLPAKEFPMNDEGIKSFTTRWFDFFDVDYKNCSIFMDIKDGIAPAGIEYYLPLFFEQVATLFDYLPENTLVFTDEKMEAQLEHVLSDAEARYESRRYDIQRPILPPKEIFLKVDEVNHFFLKHPRIAIQHGSSESDRAGTLSFDIQPIPKINIDHKLSEPLHALRSWLEAPESLASKKLFVVESAGRREALLDLLGRIKLRPKEFEHWQDFLTSDDQIGIAIAPLESGFWIANEIAVVTENQLFGQLVRQERRRKKQKENADQVVRNLTELRVGAPVVHIDNGVGRYKGLESLAIDGQEQEFLLLEYADEAKLYVPVSNLHLISRYSGADDGLAPLHKLGTEKWSNAKQKALEKIRDTAAELLDIYARREAKVGFSHANPDQDYERFAASFPFEETPDQTSAIEAVIGDMTAQRPMDRLVCGDVGFGKTEVAMRAAFMAVQSGKQVAILVPTTLLAQQHYENFRDRFADWPVQVDVISRFKTGKTQTEALERIADGKVDIVVGTHKLIQKDVKFKNLGLLIIDEEHRFGVQQKETIKSLRSNVDILTLTATPIPRTLNMAMGGIRDLSIIATPPARRLSVKTFVRASDDALVKEAILREILRGGQVYFLHNEVKTMEKTVRDLEELVPEARITYAHGQMSERELESVMTSFYHNRHNVLVCSTIVETGIDIPNANTMIINRADKFGLAQLHQLRGRVGRSHHQAYAYLLTPNKKNMTSDAVKRLEAIEASQDLGAGFMLATHDLEIRGAGELLGDEQSGQMEAVGYTLYMEMLEKAVKAIKEGKTNEKGELLFNDNVEINLRLPALIPSDYLPDINARLTLYKRIASAKTKGELRELQVEMIDRFGLLPEAVKFLFRQTELKLRVEALGVTRVDAGMESGRLEFGSNPSIDPFKMVQLVQTRPTSFKIEGNAALKFMFEMPKADDRFKVVNEVLDALVEKA